VTALLAVWKPIALAGAKTSATAVNVHHQHVIVKEIVKTIATIANKLVHVMP